MKKELKFGTDGWRDIIGDGFTYQNVERITQATCRYVLNNSKNKNILIGYDNRFLSERFALAAARVAIGNGFKVVVSDKSITSPTLSFQVKAQKASIGIMITASHNPHQFNGFKLKGPHGGSVGAEWTKKIEELLDSEDIQHSSESIVRGDFLDDYVKNLKKMVGSLSLQKLKGPVVFDSMFGPGAKPFEKIFKSDEQLIILRSERDPLFGGVSPEPIETYLTQLKEQVIKNKAAVGIAVDGDADRIGLVDDKGTYIPPHTVMPLLIYHLAKNKKLHGSIVQTVSMGYLPKRLADKYKLEYEETEVGFKHVAEKINNGKVLLGGEESGGYGVGLWSPERDGLLCALLVIELLIKEKRKLSEIIASLYEEFGASYFQRVDFPLNESFDKAEWLTRITSNLKEKISGHIIKNVNLLDGVKIVLENEAWVLLRPSGTEPLIRTYSEGPTHQIVTELLEGAKEIINTRPPVKKSSGKNRKLNKAAKK